MGIITEIDHNKLNTAEGDCENEVTLVTRNVNKYILIGYAELPVNPETVVEEPAYETIAEDTAISETIAEEAAESETFAENAAESETTAEQTAEFETTAEGTTPSEPEVPAEPCEALEYPAETEAPAGEAVPEETADGQNGEPEEMTEDSPEETEEAENTAEPAEKRAEETADAPEEPAEPEYICGNEEHTHTDECLTAPQYTEYEDQELGVQVTLQGFGISVADASEEI